MYSLVVQKSSEYNEEEICRYNFQHLETAVFAFMAQAEICKNITLYNEKLTKLLYYGDGQFDCPADGMKLGDFLSLLWESKRFLNSIH